MSGGDENVTLQPDPAPLGLRAGDSDTRAGRDASRARHRNQ